MKNIFKILSIGLIIISSCGKENPKKIEKTITLKPVDIKVDSNDIDKESQLLSKTKVAITKKKQLEQKIEEFKLEEIRVEEPEPEVVVKDKKTISKPKLNKNETKETSTEKNKELIKVPNKEEDEDMNKEKEVFLDISKLSKTKKHTKKVDTNELFNEEDLDYRNVMLNYDFTKNKTLPKITKYEKALIVGKRAKQIEEGANPNVKVLPGQTSIDIAEEELRQRKIPFIIKRPIGNKFEYWKPIDMEVIMD
jgi:DNA-directed RNA polymerase I, II, and III subunit RPABC2